MIARLWAWLKGIFGRAVIEAVPEVVQDAGPTIVEAIGSAVGRPSGPLTAAVVEQAMVEAVKYCLAKGISDPNIIRKAQLVARDVALGRR